MLLAIDPGADSGWARFENKSLAACGLNAGALATVRLTRAVVEKPCIYPGARQKARAQDVITLAVNAGEWGGRVQAVYKVDPEYVEPHRWKGQVPKEMHHPRIWARLEPEEKEIVDRACKGLAPSKRHNVIDAVGLGLWAVGRAA